jgi:hypothetical protein
MDGEFEKTGINSNGDILDIYLQISNEVKGF